MDLSKPVKVLPIHLAKIINFCQLPGLKIKNQGLPLPKGPDGIKIIHLKLIHWILVQIRIIIHFALRDWYPAGFAWNEIGKIRVTAYQFI